MGTRTTASSNSCEVEAVATTCRPWSLRMASARSWVWIRVLSATRMLIKSAPCFSWDGIGSPENRSTGRSMSGRIKLGDNHNFLGETPKALGDREGLEHIHCPNLFYGLRVPSS